MTTLIEINKLRIRAYHGVADQERVVGNIFEVTVQLAYPLERAMETDNVAHTLNYGEVVDVITSEMRKPSRLLEHVAQRLYTKLVHSFPNITGGMISVSKLAPPLGEEMESVAVTIKW